MPKLKNWNQEGLAYERCIGFYLNGKTDKLLESTEIIMPKENPYGQETTDLPYHTISDKGI